VAGWHAELVIIASGTVSTAYRQFELSDGDGDGDGAVPGELLGELMATPPEEQTTGFRFLHTQGLVLSVVEDQRVQVQLLVPDAGDDPWWLRDPWRPLGSFIYQPFDGHLKAYCTFTDDPDNPAISVDPEIDWVISGYLDQVDDLREQERQALDRWLDDGDPTQEVTGLERFAFVLTPA
jgi:hypothetical protein